MRSCGAITICVFLLSGCIGTTFAVAESAKKDVTKPTSKASESDIVTLVRNANKSWDDDFNRADSKALASHYAVSPTVMPPGNDPLRDPTAVANFFQKFFDNGVSQHSTELISTSAEGGLVYETAHWRAVGPASKGSPAFQGNLLLVYSLGKAGQLEIAAQAWN